MTGNAGRSEAWLFWMMLVLGGASVGACLVLPAWLEYEAATRLRDEVAAQVDALSAAIERVERQQEHIQNDPAYVERLAWEELGIDKPHVDEIVIKLEGPEAAAIEQVGLSSAEDLSAVSTEGQHVEALLVKYPALTLFVRDETRPIVLAMGGVMVFGALLLLGGSGHRGGVGMRAAKTET